MNKIVITFILVTFSTMVNAQLNKLTITELYDIKINNVSIAQIEATNGNHSQMNQLFGLSLQREVNELPYHGYKFVTPNFYIVMEDLSGEESFFEVSILEILTPNTQVQIGNVSIKLGDFATKLNSYVKNTQNGDNSFAFIEDDAFSKGLTVTVDPSTNKIIEIYYQSFR